MTLADDLTAYADLVVDAYAGPGGWSEGARLLGVEDVGLEWDAAACDTRAAASHRSIRCDVTAMTMRHLLHRVRLLIGSPPCTAFSNAGKGDGRKVIAELVAAMHAGDWTWGRDAHPMTVWAPLDMGRMVEECWPDRVALEQVPPALPLWEALAVWMRAHGYHVWTGVLNAADYGVPQTRRRAILMASRLGPVHPPEATHDREPVESLFGTTLPWVSMAQALGWSAGARVRDSFGAPAIDYEGREESRWKDADTSPSPSIDTKARAWQVGFPRLDDRGDSEDGYRERDWRSTDEPAFALSEKSRSWVVRPTVPEALHPGVTDGRNRRPVPVDEAAPTMHFGHDAASWRWEPGEHPTHLDPRQTGGDGTPVRVQPVDEPARTITGAANAAWRRNDQSQSGETDPDWPLDRPATTLAGRDLVADPGANANRFNGNAKSRNDGYRITVEEAAVLQSFRPDYPWQGSRTKQFQQVGNAVPPRLAAHVLAALMGLPVPTW